MKLNLSETPKRQFFLRRGPYHLHCNLPGGKGGNGGGAIKLTAAISITVNGGIYLDGGAGQGDLQPIDGNR